MFLNNGKYSDLKQGLDPPRKDYWNCYCDLCDSQFKIFLATHRDAASPSREARTSGDKKKNTISYLIHIRTLLLMYLHLRLKLGMGIFTGLPVNLPVKLIYRFTGKKFLTCYATANFRYFWLRTETRPRHHARRVLRRQEKKYNFIFAHYYWWTCIPCNPLFSSHMAREFVTSNLFYRK